MKTYITTDIEIIDHQYNNPDRYEYAAQEMDKEDYGQEALTDAEFEEWKNDNLYQDEISEIPIMNALYYFPSFVSLTLEDAQKCSGGTTLLYDRELEQWAVGMTGGGMDLTPHLVATFVNLAAGVPLNLARNLQRDYAAYVDEKTHHMNCDIVAEALQDFAANLINKAERLKK